MRVHEDERTSRVLSGRLPLDSLAQRAVYEQGSFGDERRARNGEKRRRIRDLLLPAHPLTRVQRHGRQSAPGGALTEDSAHRTAALTHIGLAARLSLPNLSKKLSSSHPQLAARRR